MVDLVKNKVRALRFFLFTKDNGFQVRGNARLTWADFPG